MSIECDYKPETSRDLVLGAYYKYCGDIEGEPVWFGPSEDIKNIKDQAEKNEE